MKNIKLLFLASVALTSLSLMSFFSPASSVKKNKDLNIFMTTFKIEILKNPNISITPEDQPTQDILATIEHVDKTIVLHLSSAYQYNDKLIPTFTVSGGASVLVDGQTQTSGTTPQNFTHPVVYVLRSKSGVEVSYTVTVNRPNKAWLPGFRLRTKLKNIDSTMFDSYDSLLINSPSVVKRKKLDVGSSAVAMMKGIEFFKSLTELRCHGNNLTTLNLSGNTALTELNCHSNRLTTLDLSKNTVLTTLDCSSNNITLLNLSENTLLTTLWCHRNRLSTLDVSRNKDLTTLWCYGNKLTMLDVSRNKDLTTLWCYGNKLSTLDVSRNKALTDLYCYENNLVTLDVSGNTALLVLLCTGNSLTELDVSKNIVLTSLHCTGNQLTTLDLSNNAILTDLSCSANQLTYLDIRGIRNVSDLIIRAIMGTANLIQKLLVHENIKNHDAIKEVKTALDTSITISTWSALDGSIVYTPICNNYNPLIGACKP